MRGINLVTLGGSVGQDPEVKEVGSSKVATFSIAVNEEYKNKQGEKVQNTHWFNCEAWAGLAGLIEQYVKKGSNVYVQGTLAQDKYEDKDGNKRSAIKVKIRDLQFLPGGKKEEGAASPVAQAGQNAQSYTTAPAATAPAAAAPAQPAQAAATADAAWSPDESDDLPF